MAKQPRPSTRSSNPRTAKKRGGNRSPGGVARAHRDDTPEAREQARRAPKTHPTRTAGARRKGPGARGRPATPSDASPTPKPREPAMKRREKRGRKRMNSPS